MSCKTDREETLGLVKPPLYIHTYHLYSRRKRSLEREWDCFPCLGPSHLEGSYLRFHLPEIFREGCLLLPGAAGAVCRAPISPHLSCCRHCFCCLCLLSLPVCVPRGSACHVCLSLCLRGLCPEGKEFPFGGHSRNRSLHISLLLCPPQWHMLAYKDPSGLWEQHALCQRDTALTRML